MCRGDIRSLVVQLYVGDRKGGRVFSGDEEEDKAEFDELDEDEEDEDDDAMFDF